MNRQRHSGFAQFPDDGTRDQFIRTVLEGNANLNGRAYISGSRPTIVFENITARERARVISALEGLGNWFEDVQFETMG